MRQSDLMRNLLGYRCNLVICVMSRASQYVYCEFFRDDELIFTAHHIQFTFIQKLSKILFERYRICLQVEKVYPVPRYRVPSPSEKYSFEDEYQKSPFANRPYRPVQRIFTDMELFEGTTTQCINPYNGYACRQCANCLSARSAQWSARLLSEAQEAYQVIPVCLTYTDALLTLDKDGVMLLNRKDVSDFVKRLRKYFEKDKNFRIKYFFKGEYGDANVDSPRPHLHGVLYFYGTAYPLDFLYSKICKAWHSAMLKFRGEDYPNMDRPQNFAKEYQVNPILEVEEWNGDTAKYTSKYTVKSSVEEFSEGAKRVPEFIQCSKHLGLNQYSSQVASTRSVLKMLYDNYLKINSLDTLKVWLSQAEKYFTFFADNGKGFPLPSYLKSSVFNGYWKYDKRMNDIEIRVLKRLGHVVRFTKELPDGICYKYWSKKGEEDVNYLDMYHFYNDNVKMLNFCKFFRVQPYYCDDTRCVVPLTSPSVDILPTIYQRFKTHQFHINEKAENRIRGQKKKIAEKIVKRSKFIKNAKGKKGEVTSL